MVKTDLNRLIGKILVFGWQEDTVPGAPVAAHARELIEELYCGGLILMGRNVRPPRDMERYTQNLQSLATKEGASPLFLAVDQEGGRVNRLNPPEYTRQPALQKIGATGDTENARHAAAATGRELKAVGINWNFAPVLDVNSNPKNPVIGDRSFADDPEMCARLGRAAIQGYQDDAGILACGKHFPGHGDTDVDSHLGLPRISHDRKRLESVELVPFRAAIAGDIAAIMTSHILFSALDPIFPATLSSKILTGLLRKELRFSGLIVTDCLEMKGVTEGWGSAEAAVLSVLAGADLLLCCHTLTTQRTIRDALVEAVTSGRIPLERIEDSAGRIESAKRRWLAGQNPDTSGRTSR